MMSQAERVRPEEWRDLLGRIEQANAEGLRITAQICGRSTQSVLLGFELLDESVQRLSG